MNRNKNFSSAASNFVLPVGELKSFNTACPSKGKNKKIKREGGGARTGDDKEGKGECVYTKSKLVISFSRVVGEKQFERGFQSPKHARFSQSNNQVKARDAELIFKSCAD